MAEIKRYLDLAGLEVFWGKVKSSYEAADLVISNALAAETERAEGIEAGLRADVDSKVAQSEYDVKVAALELADTNNLAEAKGYTDTAKTALQGNIDTVSELANSNKSAIEVLNGGVETAGSVAKQIKDAIDGVIDGAPEAFDTLKEVATWIANDETGAAAMANAITKLNGDESVEGSVDFKVKAEADRAKEVEGGLADRITSLEEALGLDGEEGETISNQLATLGSAISKEAEDRAAADEALQGNIDALSGTVSAMDTAYKAADATLQGNIDTLSGTVSAMDSAYKLADQGLDTRIQALESFAAVDYVTEAEWEARAIETSSIEALFA